ncbi:MAG: tetratricopeptide repeat protein [Chitinispirillaceae bacterium]|nr:tetratricopeptide repeat protein [Chitinispirillaceae bacterium]
MAFLQFSQTEWKLIKKVVLISTAACLLVVTGTWTFFKVQMQRKIAMEKEKSNPNNSRTVIPLDIEAHRKIADRYLQTGAPEKAVEHLERVHALDKKNTTVTLELAHAALEAGIYQKALTLYDQLLEKNGTDSSNAPQCARRGIALFYLNRVDQSEEALLECVKRFPDNAEAYCFLGQIEASRGLPSEKAVNYFNRSIAIDSTYSEAWYQLARVYMLQKLYPKARELLLKAVSINPFHSKSHSRLGMVYYYLDYPELAKKSYQTALILNPDDFNTHYNLGELLYGIIGDTIAAVQEFKQALALNPRLYEAAFKVGLICMKNGMNKEAIGYFEQALKESPDDVRILLQCAVAWEKISRFDRARKLYQSVLSVDELNSVARQKLKLLDQKAAVD